MLFRSASARDFIEEEEDGLAFLPGQGQALVEVAEPGNQAQLHGGAREGQEEWKQQSSNHGFMIMGPLGPVCQDKNTNLRSWEGRAGGSKSDKRENAALDSGFYPGVEAEPERAAAGEMDDRSSWVAPFQNNG